MSFGEKLKHIREDVLRLTQQELADSIGSSQAAINRIEKGISKNLSFDFFKALVNRHHVNPMYFLSDNNKEPEIIVKDGPEVRSLKKKVMKYESLINELSRIKSGK